MNTQTADSITGTVIRNENVDLTSTSEGLIANKFQRHSWITDDDRLHIMVRMNEGADPNNIALYLFSSDLNQLYRPRLIGQSFDHQAAVSKQKLFRASTGV